MQSVAENEPAMRAGRAGPFAWPRKVDLFGLGMSITTYEEAVGVVLRAAAEGVPGMVSCQAVHAVVTACGDADLLEKANAFDLVTPDGQPVRWAMNLLHGARLTDRVYGPELMLRLCRGAAAASIPIYLYGGSPDVAQRLPDSLRGLFPDLRIVGTESPPYRALTPEEDAALVERIRASGARLVFIGLGCPKQDLFAYQHRRSIDAVQVCVGAAFDFHAGAKKMAPAFMQRNGLEWLYRLSQEPSRLWKRYLVTNSIFLAKFARAMWHRRRSGPGKRGDRSIR
jgi:exopolysaccharide biosynthesis WecB/TagA/CpsF family protein